MNTKISLKILDLLNVKLHEGDCPANPYCIDKALYLINHITTYITPHVSLIDDGKGSISICWESKNRNYGIDLHICDSNKTKNSLYIWDDIKDIDDLIYNPNLNQIQNYLKELEQKNNFLFTFERVL